ncbi:MAG: hypothetical protein F4Y71_07355 [Acidobacteria bacterium]|nr:hypothetical protein [Acidobacteriota bacterium]MYF76615.1 hypothetical protein [Acidobacteriota bacterium]MYG76528.1 hypothetical protein [Acidobacteriota bacterium]
MRNSSYPRGLGLVATTAVLGAAVAVATPSAERTPLQSSEPYSVFVSRAGEVDAALDVRLTNAVIALTAELVEFPERFRVVESADGADVRITIFGAQAVTGEVRHVGGPAGFTPNRVFESRGSDFFSFDAVVRVDGNRKQIQGSGTGATETGSFRSAATDFVRRLEAFAQERTGGPR